MANQQENQGPKKKFFPGQKNQPPPPKREVILQTSKRPVQIRKNGLLVAIDVKLFYKDNEEPLKDVEIELREIDTYITHSLTGGSGSACLAHVFPLDRESSNTTLDLLVDGYTLRASEEIIFPSVVKATDSPAKHIAEHMVIETGYSKSKKQYYVVTRLLEGKGVALEQDIVITIDGVSATQKTDKNGYNNYYVPADQAPEKEGEEIKVTVTASGIKEHAYEYLRKEKIVKTLNHKFIFSIMLIVMACLWLLSLMAGFSTSFTRFLFYATIVYSCGVIPVYFFIFLYSQGVDIFHDLRNFIRKITGKFSSTAGDSPFEKIGDHIQEARKNHTQNAASHLFSSAVAGAASGSGKGFMGWAKGALKNVPSFVRDAAVLLGIESILKKLFRH